tara:strand:- start:215 stop:562 length:348 start_codon:yes stop_codon:yes gene_type:complete
MNSKFIYKICTINEWHQAKKKGQFNGTKKDTEDGFIHFSNKEQLNGTLNKFFFQKNNLILLKVNATNLEKLVYEKSSDGEKFPHLYEPLDISNVIAEHKVELNKNGCHKVPLEIL